MYPRQLFDRHDETNKTQSVASAVICLLMANLPRPGSARVIAHCWIFGARYTYNNRGDKIAATVCQKISTPVPHNRCEHVTVGKCGQATFDRYGNLAPHGSCSFLATLRGQSAGGSHSNSFASIP